MKTGGRHSGLQLQVLSFYKAALRMAKVKDNEYPRGNNYRYVQERFREDAFSIPRSNFTMIEHLLRKGKRDLKTLERMKNASFTYIPRE